MANTFRDADNNENYFKTTRGTGASGTPYVEGMGLVDANDADALGTTTGAAVITDANGTILGYLRGNIALLAALSKAEDAIHTNGDKGIMALVVRKDTAAALAGADGDYAPLLVDATGRLWVKLAADDRAMLDAIATSVGELTEVNYLEDDPHTNADKGTMILAVRKDTAAALAGADGDYIPFIADSAGRLHVNIGNLLGLTSRGQQTKANSIPVVMPSDQTVSAGFSFKGVEKSGSDIAMTAVTYTDGEVIGGKITLANIALNKAARLDSLNLQYDGGTGLAADILILFFGSDPTASTITDNTVLNVDDAEKKTVYGPIKVLSTDWETTGSGGSQAGWVSKRGLDLGIVSSGNIYAAIVAKGTITGVANALSGNFNFTQDA